MAGNLPLRGCYLRPAGGDAVSVRRDEYDSVHTVFLGVPKDCKLPSADGPGTPIPPLHKA